MKHSNSFLESPLPVFNKVYRTIGAPFGFNLEKIFVFFTALYHQEDFFYIKSNLLEMGAVKKYDKYVKNYLKKTGRLKTLKEFKKSLERKKQKGSSQIPH